MKLLLSLFFLFAIHLFQAQNLIPNPSFEDTSSLGCPYSLDQVSHCKYWYKAGYSPDYYNTCSSLNYVSVPYNTVGYQPAYSGNAYCGLLTPSVVFQNWYEYIGVKLTNSLNIGQAYEFKMYLNLSDQSKYATDGIGALLSTNKIINAYFINRTPQVYNNPNNFITNKTNWVPFKRVFIADSNYQYLTIGNFKSLSNLNIINLGSVSEPSGFCGNCTYLLVDDVSLTPINLYYICSGDSITLNSHRIAPYKWVDKNNPSIIISTDSVINVSPTSNSVFLNYFGGDTIRYSVNIIDNATFSIGADTNLCQGKQLLLHPLKLPNTTYVWQDSSTNPTFNVEHSGTYWVQATNACGIFSDTISVTYNTIPVNLGNDTTICPGALFLLSPKIPNGSYLWQDYSTDSTYYPYLAGKYWVQVTDSAGCGSDTIKVSVFHPEIKNFLGNDTSICTPPDTLTLVLHKPEGTYLWSTGSTDSIINITKTGKYWVKVKNMCYTNYDTIQVNFYPSPYFHLNNDTTICIEDSLTLHVEIPPNSHLYWQGFFDYDEPNFIVDYPGTVYATITTNHGCSFSDTTRITYINCDIKIKTPNVFTPNNDGINDVFSIQVSLPCKGNITIVNRWGNLMYSNDFESNTGGKINLWDGKSQGRLVTEGTYFYLIDLASQNGKSNKLKGFVEVSN